MNVKESYLHFIFKKSYIIVDWSVFMVSLMSFSKMGLTKSIFVSSKDLCSVKFLVVMLSRCESTIFVVVMSFRRDSIRIFFLGFPSRTFHDSQDSRGRRMISP